jgi:hypothetical protein
VRGAWLTERRATFQVVPEGSESRERTSRSPRSSASSGRDKRLSGKPFGESLGERLGQLEAELKDLRAALAGQLGLRFE